MSPLFAEGRGPAPDAASYKKAATSRRELQESGDKSPHSKAGVNAGPKTPCGGKGRKRPWGKTL
ncbi:MAG: hypothetical protein ABR915_21355 [Thermoguttaceae bacterium]